MSLSINRVPGATGPTGVSSGDTNPALFPPVNGCPIFKVPNEILGKIMKCVASDINNHSPLWVYDRLEKSTNSITADAVPQTFREKYLKENLQGLKEVALVCYRFKINPSVDAEIRTTQLLLNIDRIKTNEDLQKILKEIRSVLKNPYTQSNQGFNRTSLIDKRVLKRILNTAALLYLYKGSPLKDEGDITPYGDSDVCKKDIVDYDIGAYNKVCALILDCAALIKDPHAKADVINDMTRYKSYKLLNPCTPHVQETIVSSEFYKDRPLTSENWTDSLPPTIDQVTQTIKNSGDEPPVALFSGALYWSSVALFSGALYWSSFSEPDQNNHRRKDLLNIASSISDPEKRSKSLGQFTNLTQLPLESRLEALKDIVAAVKVQKPFQRRIVLTMEDSTLARFDENFANMVKDLPQKDQETGEGLVKAELPQAIYATGQQQLDHPFLKAQSLAFALSFKP